jgi:hypothetical protein
MKALRITLSILLALVIFGTIATSATPVLPAAAQGVTATATPAATITATPVATLDNTGCNPAPESFQKFDPDLGKIAAMSPISPTRTEFLQAHGLLDTDVQPNSKPNPVWEPGLFSVRLQPENYGKLCLPLLEGWVYTTALPDGRTEVIWGGDTHLTEIPVLWGFSARYLPAYNGKLDGLGGWLSVAYPLELAVKEYRYGLYGSSQPYYVGVGNLNLDWTPPAITATEPRDWRDAAALLGGRAVESEWTNPETGVWKWRYTSKVEGSATYCSPNYPCWQTAFVPLASTTGYVEMWVGSGPEKFYSTDLATLMDGQHNSDEFTFHTK